MHALRPAGEGGQGEVEERVKAAAFLSTLMVDNKSEGIRVNNNFHFAVFCARGSFRVDVRLEVGTERAHTCACASDSCLCEGIV